MGCGDDTSALDATSSPDVPVPQDVGQDGPSADAAEILDVAEMPDVVEAPDVLVMSDAGVDAPDSSADSGPHEHAAMAARRLNASERALRDQRCGCAVESGEYPTLEDCIAEQGTTFDGDEEIECVQALLDDDLEQRRVFDCQVDAFEWFEACVLPLICEELEAAEFRACSLETQDLLRACGRSDGDFMDRIQACGSDD